MFEKWSYYAEKRAKILNFGPKSPPDPKKLWPGKVVGKSLFLFFFHAFKPLWLFVKELQDACFMYQTVVLRFKSVVLAFKSHVFTKLFFP